MANTAQLKNSELSKLPSTNGRDAKGDLSKETRISLYQIAQNPSNAERLFPLPGSINDPQTTYASSYFQDWFEFPWNPDKLAQNHTYKIYDEMKDDDQVKATISFKKDFALSAGWRIVCDSEEVREFVETNLKEKLEEFDTGKSFDDVVRDILSSYEYGFSCTEPVYALNNESKWEIKSIKVRPPHSFRFDLDRFGNIISIIQATDQGDISIDPKKLIHHVYQQEYGNPYGKSDLKAAHTAWAAKKFFTRFFNVYVERFAMPAVVGRYNPNMDTNEIARMNTVLKTLQHSTTFVFPDDMKVEFMQADRDASDVYIKGLEMYNLWIARAILVPDLLGISGAQTSGGSYSLGQTQFKLFLGTIEKDRKSLARKITLRLIRPLVQVNFGDIPCSFEFNQISEESELEYARIWSEFTRSRIVTPTEEEINHFRRSVKFPEGPVEIQPLMNPFDKGRDNGKEEDKEDEKEKEKKEKKFARELTIYEKVVNFAEIKTILDTSENKILPKLTSSGRAIINDFLEQVRDKGLVRRFEPEKINTLQPRFLKDMNVEFKNYFIDLFKRSYENTRKEFFPQSTRVFVDSEIFPEDYLDIIKAESFKQVGDYTTEITKKGKNVLTNGIKNGLGEGEIVRQMKEAMTEASERWLQVVVRTKTAEIFNDARKVYWETDEVAKEIVEAYQWSSILDDRTSAVCEFLHGKIFERGEFSDRVDPPIHMNCRSILVPITKFQEYEADNEPSIEKLISMGGNLLLSQKGVIKKYQEEIPGHGEIQETTPVAKDNLPNIIISNKVIQFGDTLIIAPPGRGRYLHLIYLKASNLSTMLPVVVGFKEDKNVPLRWSQMLNQSGGFLEKDFRQEHFIQAENTGLIINLSAEVEVDYTCEYIITDSKGKRIR